MNPDPCERCQIHPATVGELVCGDCLADIIDEMELIEAYRYAEYGGSEDRYGAGTYLEDEDA